MRRFVLACALPALLCGCPNTDTAVFVEPTITAPDLDVAGSVLGVSVTGGFTLNLHLGARAAGSSTVDIGAFSVVTPDDAKQPIVSPLPVSTDPQFPITVDQDSDATVSFTFDTGKDPLPTETRDTICGPGAVVFQGTIEDSLADSATPVFSAPFTPGGC